jgi:hypothetical protein
MPASASAVLSVAGVEANGQVWEGSSRGPAALYPSTILASGSPSMAHLATLGGEEPGTSYSSPRACADVIVAMADPQKLSRCSSATDLLRETYGLKSLPNWNTRTGFHKMTA